MCIKKSNVVVFSCFFLSIMTAQANNIYAPGATEAANKFKQAELGASGYYNYLALYDHIGPSGVPLGGIGTGCFDFLPDGRISRIGINGTHEDRIIKNTRASFFAVSQYFPGWPSKTITRRLVRDGQSYAGLGGSEHTIYRGLFPTANLRSEEITIKAYSGLIPHNIKDSSLPVVFFELTAVNCERADSVVSLAMSWEDIIGRNIIDLDPQEQKKALNIYQVNEAPWKIKPRISTKVKPFNIENYTGICQFAAEPLTTKKATFQNLVTEVAVLAENQQGMEISLLPGYDVDNPGDSWKSFAENGTFKSQFNQNTDLYELSDNKEKASVVAIKFHLKMGEKKTVRFMVAWYHPEYKVDKERPESYFGNSDYGRYYHNYFNSLDDIVVYAQKNRKRILEETLEWQKPILESTYPDWLKFKLINSAYVIYTNSILNKAGNFTIMEGGMFGLAGTMDQRNSCFSLYQKLFTELDRAERKMFGVSINAEGGIPHFDGSCYHGLSSADGKYPIMDGSYLDNTAGWMTQLVTDYLTTGDKQLFVEELPRFKKTLNYLISRAKKNVANIPQGATTFEDDFCHAPVYAYTGPIYLETLNAAKVMAKTVGDEEMMKLCEKESKMTLKGMNKYLWNGRFYSFACESDGSNPGKNWLFSAQLAGQFLSRYCFSMDVVSPEITDTFLNNIMKTALSASPNYYTNKIFDVDLMAGVDERGSQCWGFYLESYVAMLMIQSGYIDAGLELMQSIQNVHLSKGWTWTQNLWNPGEMTYMTAPVTWFITDVLAGTSLNVPEKTLSLGPIVDTFGHELVVFPVYYPKFWANIVCNKKQKTIELQVTKTFSDSPVVLEKIIALPAGLPSSKRHLIRIKPFVVESGKTLDLSKHYDVLTATEKKGLPLYRAGELPFKTLNLQ